MKAKYEIRFIDIILIQLCLVLCFSWIYFSMLDHFEPNVDGTKMGYIDSLFLSTSIQAGVGLSNMQAKTVTAKCMIILQQMTLMISATYILFTFTIEA
jgi:hypothetical protein